jgi:Cu(I)/Ag(I) efflux system membrane fusion protein
MFVSITVAGPVSESLLVPTEAIIETGRRTVVIRGEPDGTFAPAEVSVGLEANGQTEITAGLSEGDRIVVSGQFLIDSEASMRSAIARMGAMNEPTGEAVIHEGEGRIDALAAGELTLSHGPIPSLQWGQMTMRFALPAEFADAGFAVGETVRFRFVMRPDGQPEITAIEPTNGDPQ